MRPFGCFRGRIVRSMRSVLPHLKVGCLLVVASTALICWPPVTLGDEKAWIVLDPAEEMSTGRATSIRMDSQHIVIRENWGHNLIDATFRLFNTGKTTAQSVGVPRGWAVGRSWPGGYDFMQGFKGWVNGLKVHFTDAKQEKEYHHNRETWKVAEVTLPGNALTAIRIKFRIKQLFLTTTYTEFWKWRKASTVVIKDCTKERASGLESEGYSSCPGPRRLTENLMVQEL